MTGPRPLWPILFLAAGLLGAVGSSTAGPAKAQPQEPEPPRAEVSAAEPRGDVVVYRIPVHGVIELGLAPFIERSLREAGAAGARAAILDMETPGGRLDAAQRIVNALADAPIPVYAFVNHRAYSAGAMIALATDRIFMRPGSVIGAATPVTGEGEKAPEKIVSAMRSEMRALAEARGLDPRIAEAMVDEDVVVPDLAEAGKLLTLTTEEAVRVGYASAVDDWAALLAHLGLEGADVVHAEVNWAESVVRFLTHPLVTPLLLSLGFLGIIIELKTPAFGLAGVAGVLSLALFFGSHYIVGLAGWEEILLLLIGLVLLAIEIFVVPGFGIFGIGGILAVLVSLYLSLIGQFATAPELGQAATILSVAVLVVLVSLWALLRTFPNSRRLAKSGILLDEETAVSGGYISAAVRSDLEGATGVALTDLHPSGTALINDERLDVVTEGGWISADTPVRVVKSEGYRHVVRPLE